MARKLTIGWLILAIFLGAIIGGVLGELVSVILPGGVVKDFFTRSISIGFSPVTLNLVLMTFTLGFTFKLNIIGVIGLIVAAYIVRWYF